MQDKLKRERLIRNSIDQAWMSIELGPGWEKRLTNELIEFIEPIQAENETLRNSVIVKNLEIVHLRRALEQISKGEGRFSTDQLTHAANTIEDMKGIALAALQTGDEK